MDVKIFAGIVAVVLIGVFIYFAFAKGETPEQQAFNAAEQAKRDQQQNPKPVRRPVPMTKAETERFERLSRHRPERAAEPTDASRPARSSRVGDNDSTPPLPYGPSLYGDYPASSDPTPDHRHHDGSSGHHGDNQPPQQHVTPSHGSTSSHSTHGSSGHHTDTSGHSGYGGGHDHGSSSYSSDSGSSGGSDGGGGDAGGGF